MARRIDLEKTGLAKITGQGLQLEVTADDKGRILVRVESELGGRRILIKQHEDDPRCIVYSLDQPVDGPHLSLVK